MLGIKKRDTKQVFKAIAHQQGVSVFNQSGIGVRAITMTAKTAPANAAAPITAAVFLLRFFFIALQISMAPTTQTAASAMTSVSHNHESSYNILIRSPYLSLANWDLFHFLLKKYCIKAPINNPTEEITKYQMECMSAESL